MAMSLQPVIGAVVIAAALAGGVGFALGSGGGADGGSRDDGPTDGPVRIALGDEVADVMAQHGPGTTYVLAAGVHRGQTMVPKDGDRITGEPGAVLSGAEVLEPTDFQLRDGVWVLQGRVEEELIHGETDAGFERDAAIHDLWADNLRLQHVTDRALVDEPGEWFFDYEADEVVMADAPDGVRSLELSVTPEAVVSEAADVVISDLTVMRYASRAQRGAIHADGPGWQVQRVTVTQNHGVGVGLFDGGVLADSVVTNNGQLGVTADPAEDIRVEGNEIAYNGTLGYQWFWESGGTKFKRTRNAVVAGNWVHHNDGPGIWFDLDNTDLVVADNLAERNEVMGLFLEVSSGATVEGNTIRGNGFGPAAGALGAGLSVSNVSDALVTDNVLSGNFVDLSAIHYDRTSDVTGEAFTAEGLRVVDNWFRVTGEGGVGFYVDTDEQELYSDGSVTFTDNTYVLDGCTQCFRWGELTDADGWLAVGNDTSGTIREG